MVNMASLFHYKEMIMFRQDPKEVWQRYFDLAFDEALQAGETEEEAEEYASAKADEDAQDYWEGYSDYLYDCAKDRMMEDMG